MCEWRRYPTACRADYELLVDDKPTGFWVRDCGHPTALRPYYVTKPDGSVLDRKFKHLVDAQFVAIAVFDGAELGADGLPQGVIPGAEQRLGASLQRKADAPLRPRAAQKPADVGLFGDGHLQNDLFGS